MRVSPLFLRVCAIAVVLAVLCSCSTGVQRERSVKIDQAKFEPLYRAGKMAQASVHVGISIDDLRKECQALAAELSIARDRVTGPEEARVVSAFAQSVSAYVDSQRFWQLYLLDDWGRGEFPRYNAETDSLAVRYGLPAAPGGRGWCAHKHLSHMANEMVRAYRPYAEQMESKPDAPLSRIWSVADSLLEVANALYLGKQ